MSLGISLFPDGEVSNALLAALDRDEMLAIVPRLSRVRLVQDQILFEPGDRVDQCFFIERGIMALTTEGAELPPGLQVGMVGHEGMIGYSLLFGSNVPAMCRAIVQMPGTALRITAPDLMEVLARVPRLRELCQVFVHRLMAQFAQAAACGAAHGLAARCADWLLMAHERVSGQDFLLTHEALARALGVRRAGVTVTFRHLKDAGVIGHSRGRIRVTDEAGLDRLACGCRKLPWLDRRSPALAPRS